MSMVLSVVGLCEMENIISLAVISHLVLRAIESFHTFYSYSVSSILKTGVFGISTLKPAFLTVKSGVYGVWPYFSSQAVLWMLVCTNQSPVLINIC